MATDRVEEARKQLDHLPRQSQVAVAAVLPRQQSAGEHRRHSLRRRLEITLDKLFHGYVVSLLLSTAAMYNAMSDYTNQRRRPSRITSSTPLTPKTMKAPSKSWLSPKVDDRGESFVAVKYLLMVLLTFSLLYLIIVASVGYIGPVTGDATDTPSTLPPSPQKGLNDVLTPNQFHLINCVMSIALVVLGMAGVVRESPYISITSAIFFMLATLMTVATEKPSSTFYLATPVFAIATMATLFIIFTSMIWSSEFETPPYIIEEYKWYLNRLSTEAEERRQRVLSRTSSRATDVLDDPEAIALSSVKWNKKLPKDEPVASCSSHDLDLVSLL